MKFLFSAVLLGLLGSLHAEGLEVFAAEPIMLNDDRQIVASIKVRGHRYAMPLNANSVLSSEEQLLFSLNTALVAGNLDRALALYADPASVARASRDFRDLERVRRDRADAVISVLGRTEVGDVTALYYTISSAATKQTMPWCDFVVGHGNVARISRTIDMNNPVFQAGSAATQLRPLLRKRTREVPGMSEVSVVLEPATGRSLVGPVAGAPAHAAFLRLALTAYPQGIELASYAGPDGHLLFLKAVAEAYRTRGGEDLSEFWVPGRNTVISAPFSGVSVPLDKVRVHARLVTREGAAFVVGGAHPERLICLVGDEDDKPLLCEGLRDRRFPSMSAILAARADNLVVKAAAILIGH